MHRCNRLLEHHPLHLENAQFALPLGVKVLIGIAYLEIPTGQNDSYTELIPHQSLPDAVPGTLFERPEGCWVGVQVISRPGEEALWQELAGSWPDPGIDVQCLVDYICAGILHGLLVPLEVGDSSSRESGAYTSCRCIYAYLGSTSFMNAKVNLQLFKRPGLSFQNASCSVGVSPIHLIVLIPQLSELFGMFGK